LPSQIVVQKTVWCQESIRMDLVNARRQENTSCQGQKFKRMFLSDVSACWGRIMMQWF
jgi:hypothetical protein